MQIKQQLNRLIAKAAQAAEIPLENPQVTEAGKPEFGDYQFNGAMPLAKTLKQNPRQIAQKLIEHLP
jgi:arginyl-tRNA synthetase